MAASPLGRQRRTRLLLVGAGHAHVHVLAAFGAQAEPGLSITLVTPQERTPYSGMLPGYLAGFYAREAMSIDAAGLGAYAGAALTLDHVTGLDLGNKRAVLGGGSEIAFDLVSLDIGSQPARGAGEAGVPVKPIDGFTRAVDDLLTAAKAGTGSFRVAIVGTGPAGVELAFALRRRLARELADRPFAIVLIGAETEILTERSRRTRRRMLERLQAFGVEVRLGSKVAAGDDAGLAVENGSRVDADAVVWATSSAPAAWLRSTGLALDAAGFVRVDETLRSSSHPFVFAAGDIASLPDPRPKAGVFAVREGPVLASNLRRAVRGEPLQPYHPQKDWLTLLSSGDGRAVADKWGVSLEGRWVWWWKDWNDRRFVDRFNRLAALGKPAR